MRQLLATIIACFLAFGASGQTARELITQNIHNAGGNQLAYPGPKQAKLTPAPDDKKPFYISHYGRHGSRYLIGKNDYKGPWLVLAKADSLGKLSPLGRDVLRRVTLLLNESDHRLGELSPLGALQHKGIAKRMFERFPEVFEGNAAIDAKSTVIIRCILSMENALLQLVSMNPMMHIRHDASYHDMYFMSQHDKKLNSQKMDSTIRQRYDAYVKELNKGTRSVIKLFNDTAYANHEVDVQKLSDGLFMIACNVQNTEARRKVTLLDLFSEDEIYNNWLKDNAWWYINYAGCSLNGGTQPYSQRNLLRRIIFEADSCIALDKPGASLRYGHDTMVMPLTCLLELDDFNLQTDNIESLDKKGWFNFQIFPMASNIQIIFYRTSPADKEVLVKVLLNENEVRLPIKSKKAPYYDWKDFKEYYLNKLDAYER